jgi:hypothetical protein
MTWPEALVQIVKHICAAVAIVAIAVALMSQFRPR